MLSSKPYPSPDLGATAAVHPAQSIADPQKGAMQEVKEWWTVFPDCQPLVWCPDSLLGRLVA